MKALDVFDLTMGLIDELNNSGTVDYQNTMDYKARTPKLLTILQGEVAKIEGKTAGMITDINNDLSVSDYSCINVLPWGLAHLLVMEENEITAPQFKNEYEKAKKKIPAPIVEVVDVYGGW